MVKENTGGEASPLQLLYSPTFAPEDQLVYELVDPNAPYMDSAVAYAGLHPKDKQQLTAIACKNALGIALGDPQRAQFAAGLALNVILPNEQWREQVTATMPELAELRSQLIPRFVSHSLAAYFKRMPPIPHPIVGAGPAGTVKDVYERLGERTTRPWSEEQRRTMAVILNEPHFNAIVMLKSLGHRFDQETFCVEGDPTRLSVPNFVDSLNQKVGIPPHATYGDLYRLDYAGVKKDFVRDVLGWVNDRPTANEIFGPFDEARARYDPAVSS